jgi:hypothetical protein
MRQVATTAVAVAAVAAILPPPLLLALVPLLLIVDAFALSLCPDVPISSRWGMAGRRWS